MEFLATRIWSYSEAAESLGIDRRSVSDLMRALRRTPKVVRHNGKAKGLDTADMAALRRALTPVAASA